MAICGCYFVLPAPRPYTPPKQQYLPLVSLKSYTKIISASSRTTLTQTFVNPQEDKAIEELRYTFPLYDGVSVVGFVCTINGDRVIKGVVKEKDRARQMYKEAVERGETAGLLEQLPEASDVFTTTVGNVPAGAEVQVEITYLGELKHDAEADGIRFTIPTTIAPRYGSVPGEMLALPASRMGGGKTVGASEKGGIEVVVDVEIPMRDGNYIKTIKSPSHPIGFELKPPCNNTMSLAKAEVSIDALQLEKDIVVIVVPARMDGPIAVLEKHPTVENQRALMATFVPRFNLPSARPEIVFVCDRSGSMGDGKRIPNLKTALQVFLKSLPVGVKFNIVSFGSRFSFLFDKSRSYDQSSLDQAMKHVETFAADYGGTEMYQPLQEVFKRRYADMDLEVFMLTDGEIWDQTRLFEMVNKEIGESDGAIRLFTLGIGNDVSHALVEGLARAGNGFSQVVGDDEKMSAKVVRMLKGSLSPHISDYRLEIKYGGPPEKQGKDKDDDDGFEMIEGDDTEIIEKVLDALVISVPEDVEDKGKDEEKEQGQTKTPAPVSLFDMKANPDADIDMKDAGEEGGGEAKYAHVPTVPAPRLLQAPFNMPPMYNFNRVSLYVLLGPSSTPRTPTAVVLRGTSKAHGPVELTIPVAVLLEAAETVHQLAAKKAVGELEEGRGWIFHAKDAADGKLLKDKYPGRFGDMVEREAVRLGVTFQVGGKWCSFVAVDQSTGEEKENKAKAAEAPVQQARAFGASAAAGRLAPRSKLTTHGARRSVFSTGQAVPPPPAPAGEAAAYTLSLPVPMSMHMNTMSLGAAPPPPTYITYDPAIEASSSYSAFSAPGSAPSAPPAVPRAQKLKKKGSPGGGGLLGMITGRGGGALLSMDDDDKDEAAKEREEQLEGGMGLAVDPSDPLGALVALQAFEGFWAWTPSLYAALRLSSDSVEGAFAEAGLSKDAAKLDVAATACAVAFLRRKLGSQEDEWEMLVEKAVAWLDMQSQGQVDVKAIMTAVEKLF